GTQLAVAFGKLLRHVAERGHERRELSGPALPLGPRGEVAAPEPGGRSCQRADWINDQALAADPGDDQYQDPEEGELEISKQKLAIDAIEHFRLCEPDHETGIAQGYGHEAIDARHAVYSGRPHGALGLVAKPEKRVGLAHRLADPAGALRVAGEHRAACIHQHDGRPR